MTEKKQNTTLAEEHPAWWDITNAIEGKSMLRKMFLTDEIPCGYLARYEIEKGQPSFGVYSKNEGKPRKTPICFKFEEGDGMVDGCALARTFILDIENKDQKLNNDEIADFFIDEETKFVMALVDFALSEDVYRTVPTSLEDQIKIVLSVLEKQNLIVSGVFCHPKTFKKYVKDLKIVDTTCEKCNPDDITRRNNYGHIYGADIYCHKNVPKNCLYITPSREEVGALSVRQNITLFSPAYPTTNPPKDIKEKINVAYEDIGITLTNSNVVKKIVIKERKIK